MKHRSAKTSSLAILSAAGALLGAPALAQNAGPYTPEQVYFVLHDAIRMALDVNDDVPQPVWVSLSTVGSLVEADDKAHINDLANFCPAPSPVIGAFGRSPKLDDVYLRVIDGIVGPKRTFSADYYKAKKVLEKADGSPSDKLLKYQAAQKEYVQAWTKVYYAKDAAERSLAALDMKNAEQAWKSAGFKYEIDRARNITDAEESRAGDGRQDRRREVLKIYRSAGLQGTDVMGAFVSPASSFSPEPAKWASSTGWTKIAFDAKTDINRYSHETSKKRGFGGLSLGFVSAGGSKGGNRTTETKVHQVHQLTYEFEIMRASIKRPWLDTTLLFEPFDWTWKKAENTSQFPFVAVAKNAEGVPQAPTFHIYDSKPINCAMLPLEAIVARKRKITATVNKSDYASVVASGKAGGGGSLFGVFGGGGKQNWTTKNVREENNMVTFTVESDGIAVIGMVSQPLPPAPAPNASDTWPANAWMPPPPAPAVITSSSSL